MQQVNIWDLVVGDVAILNAGDKTPADCIIISSQNLKVQESKDPSQNSIMKDEKSDPFLKADSFIQEGTCRVVVTAVGIHSTRGVIDESPELNEGTPLQQKLFNLTETFTYIGLISAIVILITSMVILALQTGFSSDVGGAKFAVKFVDNLILALVIIMVAIPEGLPMTVGISLAYSIINMHAKDKILVRNLSSCETKGEVTEFCIGKTGTLTTEEMSVINFYVQNIFVKNTRKDTVTQCTVKKEVQ